MTPSEFKDLVRQMRNAQQRYFHTRTQQDLRYAKDYERRVDLELNTDQSAGLFDTKEK
jgi:hypothetical protein